MNTKLREELQEHLNGNGSSQRLAIVASTMFEPTSIDWGQAARAILVLEAMRRSYVELVATLMVKGSLTVDEAMGILDK